MKTAFVSGHRDVSDDEFNTHYVPLLNNAMSEGHAIVVGDYQGVDYMAQRYLSDKGYQNVIVYHMFIKPRNYVNGYPTRGGYTSDEDRDSAMTRDSDYDIAWIRTGKEKSGTAINLARRAKGINSKEYLNRLDELTAMMRLASGGY